MKASWVSGRLLGGWFVLALVTACGGGGGGDGGGDDDTNTGEPATVSAPWSNYCVATFTSDTQILDFGDPLFTVHAGDQYLLTSWDDFGQARATFAYMTSSGPYEFEFTADSSATVPFTSNCVMGQGVSYYAVFEDVSVYAAEDLATKICDLRAGTVLPQAQSLAGYSATDFNLTGPATYEVFLNAFSASCGGAQSGFVRVPQIEVFGTRTWLSPIVSIIGPT